MKWVLNILGVLLVLMGLVFLLQGINILLGSFMSGQPLWAVIGIILLVIGSLLLYFVNRRR